MEKPVYLFLIHGLLFNKPEAIEPFHSTSKNETPFAINPAGINAQFSGLLAFSGSRLLRSPKGIGELRDQHGYAELSYVEMSDTKLSFVRKYAHKEELAIFNLTKKEDCWVGTYKDSTNQGHVSCFVTSVTKEFFTPETGLVRVKK